MLFRSDKERWTGGRTHLVQIGDMMDRGPESRKAMELLMSLERQAQRHGDEPQVDPDRTGPGVVGHADSRWSPR